MHSWNKRDTRGPFYHCLYSYKSYFLKEREKIFRRESKRFIWSKTYSLTILKASQEEEKFGSTLALEIAPWNKLFKSFLHGRKKLTWIERIESACEWQPKLKSQILQRNGRAKIHYVTWCETLYSQKLKNANRIRRFWHAPWKKTREGECHRRSWLEARFSPLKLCPTGAPTSSLL